jgi:hypothetical protein
MKKNILLLFLMLLTPAAHAEGGCPPGMIPHRGADTTSCGPIPSGPSGAASYSGPTWKLTWGAIAVDAVTGDVGTTAGEFSKRDAKRVALRRCAHRGSTKCKVAFTYKNQCAAVAWPEKIGAKTIFQGAETIEVATKLAMSRCDSYSNDAGCGIVYSGCSEPVLVN